MMKQTRFLIALLAGLLGLCGCAHLHPTRHTASSPPVAAFERKPKAEPKLAALSCREREVQVHRNYKLKRIEIDAQPDRSNAGEAIVLDYYQCKKEPGPV